jgi:putative transposase
VRHFSRLRSGPPNRRVPHSFAFCANEWVRSNKGFVTIGRGPRSQPSQNSHVYSNAMTEGLHRYYGSRDLHFITSSCYHREPQLDTPHRRDLFLRILEEARQKYRFVVHGYVVMPEHFHMLMTEPELGDPSVVMKVLKERFTRKLRAEGKSENKREDKSAGAPLIASFAMSGSPHHEPVPIWQKRFYDFNVWTEDKHIEKLRYMHRNPVKRGLVENPEQFSFLSFRRSWSGASETSGVADRDQEPPGRDVRRWKHCEPRPCAHPALSCGLSKDFDTATERHDTLARPWFEDTSRRR